MKPKLKIYVNKNKAPKPNMPLVPGACIILINKKGEILLHKRKDSEFWSLPGGQMKIGESISDCCLRELKEETGLEADNLQLVGIYTSPKIIFEFDKNHIFQSFVVTFKGESINKKVKLNEESVNFLWANIGKISKLKTLPYVKKMINDSSKKNPVYFD